jgi:hypothetical protein
MNFKSVFVVLLAALGGPALAAPPDTVIASTSSSLVAVPSRTLDEFYVLPKSDLAGYRKILIDPAVVRLQKGWLKNMNQYRDVSRWLVPEDAQQIANDAAGAMGAAVAAAFTARGYEIAAAPGPGVLRLTPSVSDLYVNAPDVPAPGIQIGIVHMDAGTATLQLEARDAVTGTLLGQVVDRDTAREVGRFDRATRVSNTFWFEAMFRQWASNCAKAFEAANAVP